MKREDPTGDAHHLNCEDKYDLLLVKYKLLFDFARDIILFIDSSGKILDANRAALEAYGYTRQELLSMYVFDLRKYDAKELVRSQMKRAQEDSILFETVHKTKAGDAIPVEVSSTSVEISGTTILMSIVRDVSAKQLYLAQIRRLAFYDELTGIANRRSFRDAITAMIGRGKEPFALAMIDVDHFKAINDTLSHAVGDGLLLRITETITAVLESKGELFRLGGDEFTILFGSHPEREKLQRLLSDICTSVKGIEVIDEFPVHTSVSIGVSLYPDHGMTESTLLKKADLALYKVKESTRNGFSFFCEPPEDRTGD